MDTLPDQFDLQVRRARQAPAHRQLDFLLGSLLTLPTWWLLNHGDAQRPVAGVVEVEALQCLVIFSSAEKLHDCVGCAPNLAIPVPQVVDYCLQLRPAGVSALLVNPGAYAFTLTFEALESFTIQWRQHREANPQSHGLWIAQLASEEEDFWQSHGL